MPNINGLTLISNITGDSKDKKSDLYPADLKEIAVYVTNTDANPVKVSFASDQGSERAWKRMLSDTFSAKDKSKELQTQPDLRLLLEQHPLRNLHLRL